MNFNDIPNTSRAIHSNNSFVYWTLIDLAIVNHATMDFEALGHDPEHR